jgi:hypothetical protein
MLNSRSWLWAQNGCRMWLPPSHPVGSWRTRRCRFPRYEDLEKLKLLDAVATEGLGLHLAAPASLPRVSPKEGAGIWVPEDVSTPQKCVN